MNAPSRVVDDGRPVRVVVSGVDANGQPARGEVSVEVSAGLVEPASATFSDGAATFSFSCNRASDSACAGKVTLTATWGRVVTARELLIGPPVVQGGADAGGGRPTDGGGASFSCTGYDGGTQAGYTELDGGPLAIGCDGEPIDAVFIESDSASRISVCGTVELSEPATMPVFPRSSYEGHFTVKEVLGTCCTELRCLRNPRQVRYRFDMEANGSVSFGVGARSNDYSYSQFGYYAGTSAMPLTSHDAGTALLLDAGMAALREINFGVARGKRDGDP